MSNPTTPYGFKYVGLVDGAEPTLGIYTGQISASNTNSLYQGDPAVFSAGYYDHATATGNTGAAFNGIFLSFNWLSISAGMRVYQRAWLGQTADLVSGSTVNCKVATHPNMILQARATGASNNPLVQANVGEFINFATGATPGNNLISTYSLDATTITSSSSTLPFKIYRLLGMPETDPTSADNELLVVPANFVLL